MVYVIAFGVFVIMIGLMCIGVIARRPPIRAGCGIPFLLEAAGVLATFVRPNHIVYLCSWGLTHLPPTCNSKLFGYSKTDSSNTNSSKADVGKTEQNNVTACGCEPETRANKRLTSRDDHPH